jgi:hypothetical protein
MMMQSIADQSSILQGLSLGESMVMPKFKNKMAKAVNDDDIRIQAKANSEQPIMWHIRNVSKQPWPCAPHLLNVTTGEIQVIEQ